MQVRITEFESIAMKEGRALPAQPPATYDLSKNNWRNHWAAMRDGLVMCWIPNNEHPPFHMKTSGRIWESLETKEMNDENRLG